MEEHTRKRIYKSCSLKIEIFFTLDNYDINKEKLTLNCHCRGGNLIQKYNCTEL